MNAPTAPRSGIVAARIGLLLRQVSACFLHGFAVMGGVQADCCPWPYCSVDTRGYVVAHDGRRRRRFLTFDYDPSDPWVVRISAVPSGGGTGWLVQRDRLAAELARTADGGGGPLAVPLLMRPGEPPRELALLLPGRDRLIEFLGRSYDLVPCGSESKALASWIDQFAHYLISG